MKNKGVLRNVTVTVVMMGLGYGAQAFLTGPRKDCQALAQVVQKSKAIEQKQKAAQSQLEVKSKSIRDQRSFKAFMLETSQMMKGLETDLENYRTELQAVKLKDVPLRTVQNRLAETYMDMESNVQELSDLFDRSSAAPFNEGGAVFLQQMESQSNVLLGKLKSLSNIEEQMLQEARRICRVSSSAES